MADSFNFQRVIANMDRIKTTLPKVLANETKNYFIVENFNKQQWDGKPWEEVERRKEGTKAYKYATPANRTRQILIGSGSGILRRAVINSLQKATFERIHFEVKDVVYAKVHNEGLRAGRGLGFQMPKRQFMGQTRKLGEIQRRVIDKTIDKIWQG